MDVATAEIGHVAAGRVRRGGHVAGDDLVAEMPGEFGALDVIGDEGDGPRAGGWPGHQRDLTEGVARLAEHGFEYLLQRRIDATNHRHARHDPLAQRQQRAPHQVGGEEADQRENDKGRNQAEARNAEGQIVGDEPFRLVARRHQAAHVAVNRLDGDEYQIDGQANRRGHDNAGEEVVPQPCQQADPRRWRNDMRQFGFGMGRRRFSRHVGQALKNLCSAA